MKSAVEHARPVALRRSGRLKLHQNEMHRRGADAFRGMGQGIAIEHLAGLQLAFGRLPVRGIVALMTTLRTDPI